MIGVDEALALVLEQARPKPPRRLPLDEALGLILAEDVASDIDSPPHDKALMDGYAVIAADLRQTPADLTVLEQVTAGETPARQVVPGAATRIMTGAPLPAGADAVVVVERTELHASAGDGEVVRIHDDRVAAGQNILRQAASLKRGETVLRSGCSLRPIELGLLAEVGRAGVLVQPAPRVAVLATGNELVPPDQRPAAGQIRNSNGPMLCGLAQQAGGVRVDLGIARDDRQHLAQRIAAGLDEDVLVLSGGVSAGRLDLVPGVLQSLGVEQVFHKVNLKPGKPLWFGVLPHADGKKLVFGLPGNPVSSLVCFELFVRPALAKLAGRGEGGLARCRAVLAAPYAQRSDRPTYFPSRLVQAEGRQRVELLDWKGSADLRTLGQADSLACFPPGARQYDEASEIDVLLL